MVIHSKVSAGFFFWLRFAAGLFTILSAFSALLVLAYNNRKDDLSALEQKAKETQAEGRLSAAVEDTREAVDSARLVKTQLADAEQKLAEFRRQHGPRQLSQERTKEWTAILSKYAGQDVDFTAWGQAKKPLDFANQLSDVLVAAGWNRRSKGISQPIMPIFLPGRSGVEIGGPVDTPPAAEALRSLLSQAGFEVTIRKGNSDPRFGSTYSPYNRKGPPAACILKT